AWQVTLSGCQILATGNLPGSTLRRSSKAASFASNECRSSSMARLTSLRSSARQIANASAIAWVSLTGYSIFDPLIAAGIATWITASTVREVFASSEELIWPEKIVCGHSDHEEAAVGAASPRP